MPPVAPIAVPTSMTFRKFSRAFLIVIVKCSLYETEACCQVGAAILSFIVTKWSLKEEKE